MGRRTIIRVYEVPADSHIQATDRMLEAIGLGVERDFHVKDILRAPGSRCPWRRRAAGCAFLGSSWWA